MKDFQLTSHPHKLLLLNALASKIIKTHRWGWHALKYLIFSVLVSISLKRLWFLSSTINSGGAYGQLSLITAGWQYNSLCLALLRKGWGLEALQGKDNFLLTRLSGTVRATQTLLPPHLRNFFPCWLLKREISKVSGLGQVIQYWRT